MKPKKIILIMIDTLRADHLGCYGYGRETSPNIDRFAKENVKFDWAFSASSYTLPSVASIFTGKYPSNNSIGFDQTPTGKLNTDKDITLAEILSSNGYKTAGFVSTVILRKETNIDSGFQVYDDELTGYEANNPDVGLREGNKTNERVFDWLEKNHKDNFFLFIHYMDVHGPYLNPKRYRNLFSDDKIHKENKNLDIVPDGSLGGIPKYQVLESAKTKKGTKYSNERRSSHYIAQYDSGIRYADDLFDNLIKKLKSLGIYDESLMVLTSDHGESLGENNVWFFHGMTVTKDQIHIPLIIKPHRKMSIHTDVASSVCITPFILDSVGLDHSKMDFDETTFRKMPDSKSYMAEIETQKSFIFKDRIYTIPVIIQKSQVKYTYYHEELNKEIIYDLAKNCQVSCLPNHKHLDKMRAEFIKNLSDLAHKKDEKIKELTDTLDQTKINMRTQSENLKKDLDHLKEDLKKIHNSKSWKAIQTYRKIRKKIGLWDE